MVGGEEEGGKVFPLNPRIMSIDFPYNVDHYKLHAHNIKINDSKTTEQRLRGKTKLDSNKQKSRRVPTNGECWRENSSRQMGTNALRANVNGNKFNMENETNE